MKRMEKTTADYEAPQVEIIEIQVEQGFAASTGTGTENLGNEDWN